jgi:anti-anti-sigma factor
MALQHAIEEGVLRVWGEIDLSNAHELIEAIHAAAREDREVPIDLSRLTFIDSSGLHAIRRAAASANCGPVVLLDVPPRILRLIDIVGLARTRSVRVRNRTDG